jgi:hypothetical protein
VASVLRDRSCSAFPRHKASQLLMESFYARVLSTRRDASRLKVLELRERNSAPHLATRFELLAATGTAGYPGVLILDRRVDGKEI